MSKTVKNKKVIDILIWAIIFALMAYTGAYHEHWGIAITILYSISVAVILSLLFYFLERIVKRVIKKKITHREMRENNITPPTPSASDRLIDFVGTTVFFTIINYSINSRYTDHAERLLYSILPAAAGALILTFYRQKIKGWIIGIFKKNKSDTNIP